MGEAFQCLSNCITTAANQWYVGMTAIHDSSCIGPKTNYLTYNIEFLAGFNLFMSSSILKKSINVVGINC